jgi:hypothetical protein
MELVDYRDEWGNVMGYCNDCGEEALPDTECCEHGEVVHYDDCDCEECA